MKSAARYFKALPAPATLTHRGRPPGPAIVLAQFALPGAQCGAAESLIQWLLFPAALPIGETVMPNRPIPRPLADYVGPYRQAKTLTEKVVEQCGLGKLMHDAGLTDF